MFKILHVV